MNCIITGIDSSDNFSKSQLLIFRVIFAEIRLLTFQLK